MDLKYCSVKTNTVAWQIATEAHKGQLYGSKPYIEHIGKVRSKVLTLIADKSPEYKDLHMSLLDDIACLHDVLEDSDFTVKQIESRLTCDNWDIHVIIDALEAITKRKGESRSEYIKRCSFNPLAWLVKVADTLSNLECSIISCEPQRVFKYTKQLNRLHAEKYN